MTAFTTNFDRKTAGFSPGRVDALSWALSDLMTMPMRSWGIYELYRRVALGLPISRRDAEPVVIAAPDPRLRREQAILAERQRFADIVAARPASAAEVAEHVARIDGIITGRP
jgi:hypothetical protein